MPDVQGSEEDFFCSGARNDAEAGQVADCEPVLIRALVALLVAAAFLPFAFPSNADAHLYDVALPEPVVEQAAALEQKKACRVDLDYGPRVVVFGDSTATHRIVGRFQYEFQELGYGTYVFSERGASASKARTWVNRERAVVEKADTVVFVFGANDFDPGLGRHMRRAVKAVRRINPDAQILWSPVASVKFPEYERVNRVIVRRARKLKIQVVPWWEAVYGPANWAAGLQESETHEPYLGPDKLHLTVDGQDALARTVAGMIPSACS